MSVSGYLWHPVEDRFPEWDYLYIASPPRLSLMRGFLSFPGLNLEIAMADHLINIGRMGSFTWVSLLI